MQALEQFEELVERLLEGSFARLFHSPVHPVELARKLERSMEAGKRMGVYGLMAPNCYEVAINDVDFGELSQFVQSVERELADLVSTLGQKRGYTFAARPTVSIVPDKSLAKHQTRIDSSIAGMTAASGTAEAEVNDLQATAALPIQQVRASRKSFGWLVKKESGVVERAYPLDRKLLTVGRSLDNNIVLEDPKVSRHHAQLRVIGEQLCIMDLGATNGTLVNRRRVREQAVTYGDEISFGGVTLYLTASRPQTT